MLYKEALQENNMNGSPIHNYGINIMPKSTSLDYKYVKL